MAIYIFKAALIIGPKAFLRTFGAALPERAIDSLFLGIMGLNIVTLWCLSCITSKRLHDTGAVGWPAFGLFFFASAFVLAATALKALQLSTGLSGETRLVVQTIYYGLWGLTFLALLFWPGQKQPNRYGSPPGRKLTPDVDVFE
ncbi:DUF805 domain-containing protein [Asticcacaulis sp. BYS171W]|uniref:DUF805 domain-containing protein n=1 Tax=Asticcacaulis aquaticus TaxID=2984212 RepID=A0ABT5HW21_9CAUL|nr:DUF805 domain-containing protein [Asticcacaulis aquaticus]MDC7684265.1 DUF805 domain-containing protein [Asticcacaulis aquaticus]